MAISADLKRIYASAPADLKYVDTIALSHPLFPTTFYLTNAMQPWIFNLGNGVLQEFTPVAFQLVFPTADGRGQQDLQLAIDNVGRDAMAALEAAAGDPHTPISVTVRVYLSVTNSLPQNTPPLVLTLSDVQVQTHVITSTASRADTLNRPFPSFVYRTDLFPGLNR